MLRAKKLEEIERLLIDRKICDSQSLERGRRVAFEQEDRLDRVMVQLGMVTERQLAELYSDLTGAPLADLSRLPASPVLPHELRPLFLRSARICPLAIDHGELILAVVDAIDDFAPAAVTTVTKLPVRIEIAIPIELEAALEKLYPDEEVEESLAIEDDSELGLEDDIEKLKDQASEAPIIRLVNQMISRAVETHASDVHIEPLEERVRIRYRYDGLLHEVDSIPPRLARAAISRIKIMAKLDIAESRLPQDGRIKIAVRGTDIDLRVSTIPSLNGETAVLRVLDRSTIEFDYNKLGLPKNVIDAWSKLVQSPNGVLLVTGPTGSGKTTTLYTALSAINTEERKIFTVEDPIEYHLNGITQTQIKPPIGLTFASMLRSLLRQDPDVIMVGEIRDLETAQTAAQAALTGHLVLSTLHTNSAAATITRLRDIGLEAYLISSVLRGVIAQRLVRRLCNECKQEEEEPTKVLDHFKLESRIRSRDLRLWRAIGCSQCRNTGFKGRQAIAELLIPSADLEQLIFSNAEHTAVEHAAVRTGMTTMFEAGIDAALAGITTVQEIIRCIRSETH